MNVRQILFVKGRIVDQVYSSHSTLWTFCALRQIYAYQVSNVFFDSLPLSARNEVGAR